MSAFIDEVNGQPRALLDLAAYYRGPGRERLDRWRQLLASHRDLTFIGMGTSEHAAWLIHDRLIELGHRPVVYDAGEFLHYLLETYPRQGLFVLISQSGESVETRKVAERLGREAQIVVLTNDEGSTMARAAGLCLPLRAGVERSITNQTYLNTLGLLHLMAGGEPESLERVASTLEPTLDLARVVGAAEFIQPADCVNVIARGPTLAAARQIALTLMEGARVKASAFPAGAFRHGPFEVAGPGHMALVLAARGQTGDLCLSLAVELAEKGGRVVLFTDCETFLGHPNLFGLKFPQAGEERLFPLNLALAQGHFLHHVARLRGYEAGVFESISKVTTRE